MQMSSDKQDAASVKACGTMLVFSAQAGRPFLAVKDLVALKMEKVEPNMASTIRLQLKLTPRRANLAIRTLVLTFWRED